MLFSLNTFLNVILVRGPLLTAQCPVADPGLVLWRIPATLDAHRKPRSRNDASEIVINPAPRSKPAESDGKISLDDSPQDPELRRRAGGDDEVPLVVDHKVRPLKNFAMASSIDGLFMMLSLTNISYLAVSVVVVVPVFGFFYGHQGGIFPAPKMCPGTMKPCRNR
ncbi:MAG: hypothetical protein CM1200mP29_03790 [Verrucomicrobiota bacterium]|nr:MAG: hypothetical protein CM1200mP29_03790 [Verrucomicrobiota bacterium]